MGTSLVVQWLRILLPMLAIWVRSLVRRTKIPQASGELSLWAATKTQCSQKEKKKKKLCFLWLSSIGEGNGNPLQCSCLENPRDRGAWWAAVYGVTQSRTRLKQQQQQQQQHSIVNMLMCGSKNQTNIVKQLSFN